MFGREVLDREILRVVRVTNFIVRRIRCMQSRARNFIVSWAIGWRLSS